MAWNDAQYNPWANPVFPQGAAFGTGSPAETSQQPAGLSNFVGGLYTQLGEMARRALGNSQNAVLGGDYNPAPVVDAAMLPMGTGAIAGVPVRAGEAVLGAGPIRAYHGSPHDFDAFSLDKIGTGEGAQAYGHGLYFAENQKTAKAYRDQLSDSYWKSYAGLTKFGDAFTQLENVAREQGMHPDHAYQLAKTITDKIERGVPLDDLEYPVKKFNDAYYAMVDEATKRGYAPHKGKMYEVQINADPEHFLDWDKPLSEQAPKVQEALKQSMGPNWDQFKYANAGDAVKQGFLAPGADTTAAKINQAGIPGIKYLDAGSRASGDGSRNYVVFNDKLIDIMRKYAVPGMFGGSMAAPIFAQDNRQ